MNGLSPKEIKLTASQRLKDARYSPKKLTLWYSGVVLGLNLISVLLAWITGFLAENTGGLSGLGTRAILDTVSMVFSFAVQILSPLLSFGFLFCCIRLSRQEDLSPRQLLMGPRRWGVILRLGFLTGILLLLVGYLALQISSIAFTFLPSSANAVELALSMMEDPAVQAGNVSQQQLLQLLQAFGPVYIISAVLFVLAFIPISYRLRLSDLQIMEQQPVGAIKAALRSNRLMKGNCIALFKLDLSFWWYYLLSFLIAAPAAAAQFLPSGTMPVYVLVYAVYAVAMLALELCCIAKVQTAYCVFYDKVLKEAEAQQLPQLPPEQ